MNRLTRAGVVLGLGLGGFFDGIVAHQILGWHHLVCITEHCQAETVEQLKLQNTQDGYFHLAVWVLTLVGIVMLFRAVNRLSTPAPGKLLAGGMLAGWGIFNFVEGLIDHHILGIHHVLPGHPNQLLFDLLFLASGVLLAVVGWALCRSARGGDARPR